MASASDERDTLPPELNELAHVATFEREIVRAGERNARLQHLADLVYAHTFTEGELDAAE